MDDHGLVRDNNFTGRKALLLLGGFWSFGVVLLVGSLFGSVGVDHFRRAPACSPDQVFSSAYCRIVVAAPLTSLTREEAVFDVDGRRVSTELNLHGDLPDIGAGTVVQLTFYRGIVVHLEGGGLDLDTAAAPVSRVDDFRFGGLAILVIGTFVVGANFVSAHPRDYDAD